MIKGNELEVANIDFELQARCYQFLCFALFRNFKELFITLQPDKNLEGESVFNRKLIKQKQNIMWTGNHNYMHQVCANGF